MLYTSLHYSNDTKHQLVLLKMELWLPQLIFQHFFSLLMLAFIDTNLSFSLFSLLFYLLRLFSHPEVYFIRVFLLFLLSRIIKQPSRHPQEISLMFAHFFLRVSPSAHFYDDSDLFCLNFIECECEKSEKCADGNWMNDWMTEWLGEWGYTLEWSWLDLREIFFLFERSCGTLMMTIMMLSDWIVDD